MYAVALPRAVRLELLEPCAKARFGREEEYAEGREDFLERKNLPPPAPPPTKRT